MDLTLLPNEILDMIIGFVAEPDLFRIAQTNQLLSIMALKQLYQINEASHPRTSITYRAACHGRVDILRTAAKCGISLTRFELACNAAKYGHPEVLSLVASSRGKDPFTPRELSILVDEACSRPQLDILDLLFTEFEAAVDPQRQRECLVRATSANSAMCVQKLIDNGADPAVISTEETPLEIAVKHGYHDVAHVLIEHRANVHDQMNSNFKPIHLAAMYGQVDILKLCIKYGANPSVVTRDGTTALRLATRYDQRATAFYLMRETAQHGADSSTMLSSIHRGWADLVQLHLEAAVEAVPPARFTDESLLYVAAKLGHLDIITALLDAGVDVNDGNNHGESPLYVAMDRGHVEVADLLLCRGANPNSPGRTGLMLLDLAAKKGKLGSDTQIGPSQRQVRVEAR
jgi:ankyrin repeat protein